MTNYADMAAEAIRLTDKELDDVIAVLMNERTERQIKRDREIRAARKAAEAAATTAKLEAMLDA